MILFKLYCNTIMRITKKPQDARQLAFDFYLIETLIDELETKKAHPEIAEWALSTPERLRAALLAALGVRLVCGGSIR